jgi:hypothetical protein
MELTLIRKYFAETYTIGRLLNGDEYFCDTLEDKVRELQDINNDGDLTDPGEGKIYGETAIPYGRYRIILNYSPKLKRVLPLLLDVLGFKGIRIHKGVTAKHTLGCILVGENKVKGKVINGTYYEIAIINLIREAIKNKQLVFITIRR